MYRVAAMFLSHYDGREARPDGWTMFSEKSSGGENLLRCNKNLSPNWWTRAKSSKTLIALAIGIV